ncbi:hypothetical protein FQA47_023926 [Oryzias melastigma]|uniref:HECT domain-containing protein n=1 Tax=Oryzias melastigma TaxID=30732 RepID=A0A834F460_ORYME|nr:hypothetical protein FQA47_023926 [Oryzias melastigma]
MVSMDTEQPSNSVTETQKHRGSGCHPVKVDFCYAGNMFLDVLTVKSRVRNQGYSNPASDTVPDAVPDPNRYKTHYRRYVPYQTQHQTRYRTQTTFHTTLSTEACDPPAKTHQECSACDSNLQRLTAVSSVSFLRIIVHALVSVLQQNLQEVQGQTSSRVLDHQGGQGRQRLTDLSPDPEGYTGAQIKIATGAGKITIYIVPLQEELDLSPLQDDAKEFEKIPKAACKSCSREMPLQVLALHVEDCIPPEDEEFHLCVSREDIVERGMKLWQRQKSGSPVNPLKITFIGEAGVDTGALRLEFLTGKSICLEKRLFEGEEGKRKIPKYSISDLDKGLFRVAGEIFAVSLAQGGPAPKFLQEWCFNFLATGKLTNITKNDVHEPQLKSLIKKMPDHSVCFPVVSACAQTITFPTAHLGTYEEFQQNLTTAITCAKEFQTV